MTKRYGLNLGEIAASTKGESAATPAQPARRQSPVPIGELAMHGPTTSPHERTTISIVDPKRCRGWKFHNRHESWFTRERCQDVIESISKDDQQEPALGRKIEGDPNYDYEVIFGMRRRFACEFLNKPFRLRVVDISDQQAAVQMHIENYDRKDISPMERATSFTRQLRDGIFKTQDEMAAALQVSKGMVTQMVKAAELLEVKEIGSLFRDPTTVPIGGAYQVAARLSDENSRAAVLQSAKQLSKGGALNEMTASSIIKVLLGAPVPDKKGGGGPLRKSYNFGERGRMVLTRNARGKVTLAFRDGFNAQMEAQIVEAVRKAIKDT